MGGFVRTNSANKLLVGCVVRLIVGSRVVQ
jgi:hypothetical protein